MCKCNPISSKEHHKYNGVMEHESEEQKRIEKKDWLRSTIIHIRSLNWIYPPTAPSNCFRDTMYMKWKRISNNILLLLNTEFYRHHIDLILIDTDFNWSVDCGRVCALTLKGHPKTLYWLKYRRAYRIPQWMTAKWIWSEPVVCESTTFTICLLWRNMLMSIKI